MCHPRMAPEQPDGSAQRAWVEITMSLKGGGWTILQLALRRGYPRGGVICSHRGHPAHGGTERAPLCRAARLW